MGLISNLVNNGELPTVTTEVAIDDESITKLAITAVVVAVIVIFVAAIARKA